MYQTPRTTAIAIAAANRDMEARRQRIRQLVGYALLGGTLGFALALPAALGAQDARDAHDASTTVPAAVAPLR